MTDKRNGPIRDFTTHDKYVLINTALTSPGIYLKELQDVLAQRTGNIVSVSTICRL